MTSREIKYIKRKWFNKKIANILREEVTRAIDEEILNQLNGAEPNPDFEPFKTN